MRAYTLKLEVGLRGYLALSNVLRIRILDKIFASKPRVRP